MWLGRGREDSKISEFNVSLRTMRGISEAKESREKDNGNIDPYLCGLL